ncbi:hypothetical protein HYC85_012961 [Camellia sinensis]|uniref:Uncharacterized protein n=1 Tax=Camellia sinensis TaxID=4442 RepID=A0A7J7HGA2_CAMSI|nr:hypothetical protein HYC85_012961 [Camellia sinensis]
MKKRPQLKPSSTDNNIDNNIHDNLDQLFDNLLDQLGGNVVPEIPKIINLIVVKLTNKQRKKFQNKDHKVWYFPTHVPVDDCSLDIILCDNGRVPSPLLGNCVNRPKQVLQHYSSGMLLQQPKSNYNKDLSKTPRQWSVNAHAKL